MKRGISDIIASLILIMIASTLGLSIYLFFTYQFSIQVDNLSRSIEFYQTRLKTRYKVTWYKYNTSTNTLTMYIYNYGDTVIEIDTMYVDGTKYSITPPPRILVDKIYILNYTITLSSGKHTIRLVTTDGVTYDFEMEI